MLMQLAWKTESVIYVLRSTYKLCRLSAHGSSRVIHASLHFTAVGSCGLPCVRRAASNTASSAFSRVSLTQIGHDAICWTVERCLCNTNFRVHVLAFTRFQRPIWRCKIWWRAKLFSDLTVLQDDYHHKNNCLLRFVGLVTLLHVSTTKWSPSGH